MSRVAVLFALASLSGCAVIEDMSPAERAWQTMHLIDVAQTLNGPASDPCYREAGSITRRLIGSHPEPEAVIAWGAAYAVVHYFAFRWIDDSGWPKGVKVALRAIDLGRKGRVIVRNHREGVRIFGPNARPCDVPR